MLILDCTFSCFFVICHLFLKKNLNEGQRCKIMFLIRKKWKYSMNEVFIGYRIKMLLLILENRVQIK